LRRCTRRTGWRRRLNLALRPEDVYIQDRRFEWDADKNRANFAKHGVRFEDAVRVFEGPAMTRVDDRFAYGEERCVVLGCSPSGSILMIVYTIRGRKKRIISARRASRKERQVYSDYIRRMHTIH
jgi:uncharacterized protein